MNNCWILRFSGVTTLPSNGKNSPSPWVQVTDSMRIQSHCKPHYCLNCTTVTKESISIYNTLYVDKTQFYTTPSLFRHCSVWLWPEFAAKSKNASNIVQLGIYVTSFPQDYDTSIKLHDIENRLYITTQFQGHSFEFQVNSSFCHGLNCCKILWQFKVQLQAGNLCWIKWQHAHI